MQREINRNKDRYAENGSCIGDNNMLKWIKNICLDLKRLEYVQKPVNRDLCMEHGSREMVNGG